MKNLTEEYYQVLKKACEISEKFNLQYVGTEEIVYAILCTPKLSVCKCLNEFGATKENFFAFLKKTFNNRGIKGYTAMANNAFLRSKDISLSIKSSFISTEHLLLAILEINDCYATTILRALGVNVNKLYSFVLNTFKNSLQSDKQKPENSKQKTDKNTDNKSKNEDNSIINNQEKNSNNPLDLIGYNMTLKAEQGKIDKVIGREAETERILQTLSRKTKNSPILIGEAGVGKTAVVEGLALKIVEKSVPEFLQNKQIYSIDIGSLISGTRYRGDFEEKFKNAIDYAINQNNIILFIDEIHNIVGSGATKEGSLDIAEILKPLLARGEIMLIGATTFDEYTKYIEKDGALERRFQPIKINEPSQEDAILILKGIKSLFEGHHKVFITDEAINYAVILSQRYITDRFLPDKAIDLIDEACSKKRLEITTTPSKIIECQTKISQLKADRDYYLHLNDLDKAKKADKEIDKLNEVIKNEKIKSYNLRTDKSPSIVGEDIKSLISLWTNIPVNSLTVEDTHKLINLEDELISQVVGQDQAIFAVSKAIRRSRANLKDPNKPIGSFIFVGPTGVGKTELCNALSKQVFGSQNNLIRFDMSEYQDKNSISKLIGTAPGYVGYEKEGLLTEKIRRNPYSVVLFDEIEKAHSDVFDILLQVLDNGNLTDSKGRVVSFKNSLIILTSNIGFSNVDENISFGFGNQKNNQDIIEKSLKKTFKPEFINRLDEIIVFNNLTESDCFDIADMQINKLVNRVNEQNISLIVDDSAIDYIVKSNFNENYGARPIIRGISTYIESMLSDAIIDGSIKSGDNITVYYENEQMKFKKD